MDVLWFVVLFLVVQFFHAFSNYGPSICIPPPKYHINSSANWHSLQAVRAGCLLFRRVLLSVRTPLSILTFWPAPKLITDASQSKDSVSRCYSQTFKALQFSMFCSINIVNMQVQQNPIKTRQCSTVQNSDSLVWSDLVSGDILDQRWQNKQVHKLFFKFCKVQQGYWIFKFQGNLMKRTCVLWMPFF